MNEASIAGILRDSKPADPRLYDGWIHACIRLAETFQDENACFNALAFLNLCDISAAEEQEFIDEFGEAPRRAKRRVKSVR